MMKSIYNKTAITLFLSAFLVACGGGGGSSAADTTPIASNLVENSGSNSGSASSSEQTELAALKEKEIRSQASNKQQSENTASENTSTNQVNTGVSEDKEEEPKDKPEDQVPPAVDPVQPQPQPQPQPQVIPTYDGQLVMIKYGYGFSAWEGERKGYYEVKLDNNKFETVKTSETPSTITIVDGDNNTKVLSLADVGYYGYIATDNEVAAGDVWRDATQRAREFDMFYGYNSDKKDTVAPSVSMNYEGKFLYSTNTNDFASAEANLSLTYNATTKGMSGTIQSNDTGGGQLFLDLAGSDVTEPDFTLQATVNKKQNQYDLITKDGELKGDFLDKGKFIVGKGSSNDNGAEWRGVFGAEGTPQ
ncbi:hypothetical protein ACWA5Z_02185 [Testudinibacter sp. P80/BLE/0925]|uniref:hypothetical protein n=1 Tax=Testudinibacter sp. TW-1 TaxID=3417757 RepID=UPI003D36602D